VIWGWLTILLFLARPVAAEGHQELNLNLAIQWDSAALQGVRDARLGAPMVARALAIVHTCMYDAWAAYDEREIGRAHV